MVLLVKNNDEIINSFIQTFKAGPGKKITFIFLFNTYTIKLNSELYKIIKLNSNIVKKNMLRLSQLSGFLRNYSSCVYSFTVEVRPTYV
jgi:hypothetical protein